VVSTTMTLTPQSSRPGGGYSLVYRFLACTILFLVFGLSVYRAAIVAISHDEALTYLWFLKTGAIGMLTYSANNHILFTICSKPFIKLFGVSALSLRVPSLIAAAGYLWFVYFVCRRLFGDTILLPLAVAMLSLNPTMMDFMFLARGYGMAVAFLMAAMYILSRLADKGKFDARDEYWRWGCALASVLLALAVTANLTEVIPATSSWLCFAALALPAPSLLQGKHGRRELQSFLQWFLLPGAVAGSFILWPFLIQVDRGMFYVGYRHLPDSLRDLFNSFFMYKWTSNSFGSSAPTPGTWQHLTSDIGALGLLPILLIFLSAGGATVVLRGRRGRLAGQSSQSLLFAGAAVGCAALWFVLHLAAGLLYPLDRTFLFSVPLFTVAAILIGRDVASLFSARTLRVAGFLVIGAVIADYAAALHVRYCRYAAYDAISRKIFLSIADDVRNTTVGQERVGGVWVFEPEMNFYRIRYAARWMAPYDVKDPSYPYETKNSLVPSDYDYFLYMSTNDPHLPSDRVRVLFHDPVIGITVIAKRK
jgi:uncharacterized membrane protein